MATFRARERKRVDMLQVRLDTERDLLKPESELATLRRNSEQDSGHVQRSGSSGTGSGQPSLPTPTSPKMNSNQRLGASTPDAKIAREVGCSRRTVARWRKRFQEQGLLSAVAQSEEPSPLLKKQ